jgi:hypothetical protein
LTPGDFPGGKKGDVFTVQFTVFGVPCRGLTGGRSNRAGPFSFQIAIADQEETDSGMVSCEEGLNAFYSLRGSKIASHHIQGDVHPFNMTLTDYLIGDFSATTFPL